MLREKKCAHKIKVDQKFELAKTVSLPKPKPKPGQADKNILSLNKKELT